MRKKIFSVIVAITMIAALAVPVVFFQKSAEAAVGPVNPNASQEARDLLNYLYNIKGMNIISGQHNKVSDPDYWSDKVYSITGKYTGLWGCDFSYGSNLSTYRQNLVNEAIEQWNNGAIVTIMYHQVFPTDDDTAGWNSVHPNSPIAQSKFNLVVTPGTAEYNAWKAKWDTIATYLQQLEDAKVPVLFRPYHEMNGGWFWWGQQPKYADLYKQTYNYLTNTKGLNNILWVWNANGTPSSTYYPGSSYIDVLATDVYGGNFSSTIYNTMNSIANGKLISLGEVGDLPSISTLQSSQPNWVWFMMWDESGADYNTDAEIQAAINHSYTLTRNEIPHPLPYSGGTNTPTPTPTATPTPTPGGTTTDYNPSADVYVRGGTYASTNYGTAATLEVKGSSTADNDRIGYVKMNYSGYTSSSASAAKLYLYLTDTQATAQVPVKIYGYTSDGWSETGVTYNSQPSSSGAVYIGTINVQNTGWYSIDVTDFVNSQMSDKTVTFRLVDESQMDMKLIFSSREATSNKPYLRLQYQSQANAVENPGFENGTTSWNPYGTVSSQTTNAHSGSYSLKFGGTSSNGFSQIISGLTPNTTYTVTFWARTASTGSFSVYVKDYGGSQVTKTVSGTSYTQYSITFTTGTANTSAKIAGWTDTTIGYVDDFVMYK